MCTDLQESAAENPKNEDVKGLVSPESFVVGSQSSIHTLEPFGRAGEGDMLSQGGSRSDRGSEA